MIRFGNYFINKECIAFIYLDNKSLIINLKNGEIIKTNKYDLEYIEKELKDFKWI